MGSHVKSTKGDKGKCDTLASLIVRSAGQCMKCGVPCECLEAPRKHTRGCPLTCSHVIKRRYSGTRCDIRNLQVLCYKCHYEFENWPRLFSRWITDTIGSELYDELEAIAQRVNKVDWSAVLESLTLQAQELGIK